MRTRSLSSLLAASISLAVLTGCGAMSNRFESVTPEPFRGSSLRGMIHGGQQPVSGSTIQLYAVGVAGYGSLPTPLLTSTVQSDSAGNFSISGQYTCPSANTQVYITATGGNAGAGNNSALAMMVGLGSCGSLTSSTFIFINEITTVAAVWTLSPFMQADRVGAPSTNQAGLALAFGDIAQVANTATGTTPGGALPAGAVAPTAEINTLADILASCINSSGSSSPACASLFSNTTVGGVAPTNTIAAAVNIARNPGQNVGNLLVLATPQSPFQPTLTSAVDFTIGITYPTGSAPAALAVDAANNIWVANNSSSTVTRLSRSGSATTYPATTGGLNLPTSIAIDAAGNAWVTNSSNSLTEITSSGTGLNFTGGGLNSPRSVAIDGLGLIWVANGAASTISAFSATGAAISPAAGYPAATTTGTGSVAIGINPR